MKFLIVGDLHGKKPKIHFKDFDAIIAPGDFCSDEGIRPLKNKWVRYLEKTKVIENFQSLDTFISKTIGKREFNRINRESLKVGRSILKFLNSFNKPVFIVPGNWDQSYKKTRIKDVDITRYNYRKSWLDYYLSDKTNKFLTKGLKNIYDCQYKLYKFPEFNILGYGLSSGPEKSKIRKSTKNITKREITLLKEGYLKLENKLKKTYQKRDKNKPTIFLTHNVPYGTKLDILIDKKSDLNGAHFGSTIASSFCKKYQPLICIGSHMHEHFGKDKIGKTVVMNAGFGRNVNTFLEIKDNKIKKLKFIKKK